MAKLPWYMKHGKDENGHYFKFHWIFVFYIKTKMYLRNYIDYAKTREKI